MKTEKSTSLHIKALDALEMIENSNKRIQYHFDLLLSYDKANPFEYVTLVYSRSEIQNNVFKYRAIKKRLLNYYENLLYKIVMEGIKHNVFFADDSLPLKN
jgi:hypothetical protein